MQVTFPRKSQISRQAGYSLVELSVALAIVAVILMGSLMGTRQVLLSNSINAQVRDTAAVIAKVQRQYAKQANTLGASNTVLGPLGIWPAERATVTQSGTTVRGLISGSSEFIFTNDAAIGAMQINGGFIYTLRQVQTTACAELISALDSVAYAIYAGAAGASAPANGATPTSTVVKAAGSSAVSMANMATACSAGTTNGVDIAIVFLK